MDDKKQPNGSIEDAILGYDPEEDDYKIHLMPQKQRDICIENRLPRSNEQ